MLSTRAEIADSMAAARCLAQGFELCVYQYVITVFNLWTQFTFLRYTREIGHDEVVNVTSIVSDCTLLNPMLLVLVLTAFVLYPFQAT